MTAIASSRAFPRNLRVINVDERNERVVGGGTELDDRDSTLDEASGKVGFFGSDEEHAVDAAVVATTDGLAVAVPDSVGHDGRSPPIQKAGAEDALDQFSEVKAAADGGIGEFVGEDANVSREAITSPRVLGWRFVAEVANCFEDATSGGVADAVGLAAEDMGDSRGGDTGTQGDVALLGHLL